MNIKQSGLIRLLKPVIFAALITWAAVSPVEASDSLRTVGEFTGRVFLNLGFTDTTLGVPRMDTTDVRKCIRAAVVEIGSLLPTEKAKSIVTSNGTFGYLVDKHLDSVQAVVLKRGRYSKPIDVVPFWKFAQSFSQSGSAYDTASYAFCGVHGDSIYPYPVPGRVDTLYLFYTARGKVPTATADTVDLPHELYTAVEYAATVKAAAILQDGAKLETYTVLLDREIAKFIGGKKPQ